MLSLLVFSVTLSIALFQFSIGTASVAETVRSSTMALALADGCAESVLDSVRADLLFDDEEMTLPTGECDVAINRDGQMYTIEVSATVETTTRHITIKCRRDAGNLTLLTWLEN